MKRFILFVFVAMLAASCSPKWEYKVLTIKGAEQSSMPKFQPKEFKVSNNSLNSYGEDGWELVDVYQTIETIHPNFGDEEYVTGIQPNVRTSEINFVFKRKK